MGKVTYAPGIQYVNGSLAKPKKVDGHKCGDYLIGTHRTAETTNPDCTRLYIRCTLARVPCRRMRKRTSFASRPLQQLWQRVVKT